MEDNDVYKIYLVVATAVDMLAGGYPCFASFSDRLAFDASLEVVRYNHKRFFPFHQGLIHAPRQSPRWLKKRIGDVPNNCFYIFFLKRLKNFSASSKSLCRITCLRNSSLLVTSSN